MQGYSHALSGAAAWLAISSTSDAALGWYDASPGVAIAGAALCAGAALLPDLDHPDGTIAHSLPGVTKPLAHVVEDVSGGHRHGTHSLLGVAFFSGIAWASAQVIVDVQGRSIAIASGIYAVLLLAFALKALGVTRSMGRSMTRGRKAGVLSQVLGLFLSSWLGPWLVAGGTAGIATWTLGYQWEWMTLAVAVGTWLHMVGDSLTIQGVPWLWPWNPAPPKAWRRFPLVTVVWQPNGYFRIPVLGRTTSLREQVVAALMGLYVAYLVLREVTSLFGNTPWLP